MELRTSALQHQQSIDSTSDVDALPLAHNCLYQSSLGTIAVEGMWMWLSVDIHSRPSVSDDLDVCSMDVLVSLDEVSSEDGGIEFGRSDWGLFGFDVDGVLD